MILLISKIGCLAIYLLALVGLAGWLPETLAHTLLWISLALFAVHALELLFVFKYLPLYRGPLAQSVLLAMLFGFLHWRPLMKQVGK